MQSVPTLCVGPTPRAHRGLRATQSPSDTRRSAPEAVQSGLSFWMRILIITRMKTQTHGWFEGGAQHGHLLCLGKQPGLCRVLSTI